MRVATFSMRAAGGKDVQLMIHAEVGADYTGQKTVVLGFVIADANDRSSSGARATVRCVRPLRASRPPCS